MVARIPTLWNDGTNILLNNIVSDKEGGGRSGIRQTCILMYSDGNYG